MNALMSGDDECPHGGSLCVPSWQLMLSALMAVHGTLMADDGALVAVDGAHRADDECCHGNLALVP